jgi:hypothetical protein
MDVEIRNWKSDDFLCALEYKILRMGNSEQSKYYTFKIRKKINLKNPNLQWHE